MELVAGVALVAATWASFLLLVVALGSLPAVQTQLGPIRAMTIARSMWWGLAVLAVTVVLTNLWLPLADARTVGIVAMLALVSLGGTLRLGRSRGWDIRWKPRGIRLVIPLIFGASLIYVAAAALGPVTNYDTGLYHLGAIRYAAEFPTIPGLANLHFPFGYSNIEFPLAAFLTNGLLSDGGFRLLNGLFMAMLVADLMIRFGVRKAGPGREVLVVGITAAWIPLVALVDYWVTSPTQDSAVLLLTVAAGAYLAQGVARRHDQIANLSVAAVLAVVLVLARPTMIFYALSLVGVIVVVVVRRKDRSEERVFLSGFVVLLVGATAAVAMLLRDRVLSGWIQYPLSLYLFPVDWRAADPQPFREAILGFHRDPANIWQSVNGWSWVESWFVRTTSQWETYLLAVGLAAVVLLIILSRLRRVNIRLRAMLAVMAPSLVMLVAWWVASPPSFRFAWGPLFASVCIPVGWLWWRLSRQQTRIPTEAFLALAVAVPVVVVVAYSAAFRMPWESMTEERNFAGAVTYRVTSLPAVAVDEERLASGLLITRPQSGEQCWDVFPLCTPLVESSVQLRGESLRDGFAHQR